MSVLKIVTKYLLLGFVIKKFKKKRVNSPVEEKQEKTPMTLELEKMQEKAEEERKKLEIFVQRNLRGKELEKNGETETAIELYEANISENFEGNYPYDRLVVIYKKKKQPEEAIRVLEKAIEVFENLKNTSQRKDVPIKLQRFKKRLEAI